MKKLIMIALAVLFVLGGVFAYVLYSEGAFEKRPTIDPAATKPFMKCEAGKCGSGGKCGAT